MVDKPESDAEPKERRIDLSLPQVAGSAVAAVAAAVMASRLGVYGTIAGAGVMSIVATCGGSVFQHFFRRTGEQIREVTVQVKHPAGRQVTVRTRETTSAGRGRQAPRQPVDDATTVLRTVRTVRSVGTVGTVGTDLDRTRMLGLDRTELLKPDPDRTQVLRADPDGTQPPKPDDAFRGATTHGTRNRGRRKPALAAVAVFVLAMLGITAFELVSGNDLSGGRGTTFGSVVRGEDQGSGPAGPAPSGSTGQERGTEQEAPSGTGTGTAPGTDQGDGASTDPNPGQAGDGTATGPTPTPSGSGSDETNPTPTPTPTTPSDGATTTPDPAGTPGAPARQDEAAGDAGTAG
ncbi:hypothetical protein F0344_06900 [Streptomyces finlayi]|uniref:Uncharacterized protein n=1 Tax=Streptomyces finlayi TaxID=67296 RepID=A0A7G7BGA8_9ACTN|nr:hypothetical protein [Streptomyces finlayi]QNE74373.1 hypothetical protein F0344_06900 [Streptomyces finlayi]